MMLLVWVIGPTGQPSTLQPGCMQKMEASMPLHRPTIARFIAGWQYFVDQDARQMHACSPPVSTTVAGSKRHRSGSAGSPDLRLARGRIRNAAARHHMGARVVHRIDRNEPVRAPILDGELHTARLADRIGGFVTLGKSGDLQLGIVLIGPEPRHRIVALRLAENRRRPRLCLIDRVLHALEPQESIVAPAGKPRTVADGVDAGSIGAGKCVDQNSVAASDAG